MLAEFGQDFAGGPPHWLQVENHVRDAGLLLAVEQFRHGFTAPPGPTRGRSEAARPGTRTSRTSNRSRRGGMPVRRLRATRAKPRLWF